MVPELLLPTPEGIAPLALHFAPSRGRFWGTVLVYPGMGAAKEVQVKECRALAEAGLLAVAVDAVGHGGRRWRDFEARMSSPQAHAHFLEMIDRSAREVPAILDGLKALLGDATGRFGITGISMGGFIAFAAAAHEPRLEVIVPVLGSPDWSVCARGDEALLAHSPHRSPGAFAPRPLLALNAGRDRNVPPEPTREFVEELLRPLYSGELGSRLEYHEYPESEHQMRPEDWEDLWGRVVSWMGRYLPAPIAIEPRL
ncbi:MAG: alpha/beta fold hydrolase [Deltaproteobacteria bacterium]|nr:alpha/beta fold hydrolase [Deltaproteobacteria bacterium]